MTVLSSVSSVGFGAVVALADRVAPSVFHCRLGTPTDSTRARTSFLFAADGSPLGAIPAIRHREPLSLRQMSPWVKEGTVAIEDRRFWDHGALDYRGIARAALADLRSGRIVEGGSTITQQLARTLYLRDVQPSLRRKLTEACLAFGLERVWGKPRILASYLNHVFYGGGAYGVGAAARTYFSRPASRLTLPQAALLASLPQSPSLYDPLRFPRAARTRRNEVLAAMLAGGDIDRAQYRRAFDAPLGLTPGRRYAKMRSPEFFSFAQRELERRYGKARVRREGIRVRTTLDLRLQSRARQAMAARLPGAEDPAAALVAIDPRSGVVRAMAVHVAGGRRLQFNLASQAHRQEGSAAKVFTLAAALEQGVPLDSVWSGPSAITIPDRRCLNGIDRPWVVHNYADETAGTMTLDQAIAHSVNTIFAQLVSRVGPDNVVRIAHRLGVRSPLKPVCSITLGSQAVTPLELTTAFATLAARGIRHEPTAIAAVRLPSGEAIARPARAGRRAIPAPVADLVTTALEGVIEEGTGTAAAIGRPAAGKTGTAEGYRDAWFCGYVPQLAACVWVGYPAAEIPLVNVEGWPVLFGGSIPALVWRDFMLGALEGVPALDLRGAEGSPR